jgi:basic membrane lipoprotein Med (substrate-binding protein (PBP1-ABC) superfamily)
MMRKVGRFWWAIVAVCLGAGVILAAVLWPSSSGGRDLPPTRARVYAAWRACMVTGASGLSDPQAASVWAGMEQASAKTSAKVSYLTVAGQDTAGNARTYVATAAGEQCSLVIAVGGSQTQAVVAVARQFPRTRFAAVGQVGGGSNVSQITASSPGGLAAATAATVETAYQSGPLATSQSSAGSPTSVPTASLQ